MSIELSIGMAGPDKVREIENASYWPLIAARLVSAEPLGPAVVQDSTQITGRDSVGTAFTGKTSATFQKTLTGDDGAETLEGGPGADILIGGGGADLLIGGSGRDTASYAFATAGVIVDLQFGGSGGEASGVQYREIENVTGSRFGDEIRGSSAGNVLSGGDGNDILSGRDGKDRLSGGTGADSLDGGSGVDLVDYATSASGITIDLTSGLGTRGDAQGDRVVDIEGVEGSEFADTIAGNTARNRLSGLGGADTIDGAAGRDVLAGGAGKDRLSGGEGRDSFVFDAPLRETNVDTITDFDPRFDTIRLDGDYFSELGNKGLSSGRFLANAGGNAQDGSDGILYDTTTGRLYYDRDGKDSAPKALFAIVQPGLDLTNDDFFVF
jgi:Ca2+-binding RTX toxin-like protein